MLVININTKHTESCKNMSKTTVHYLIKVFGCFLRQGKEFTAQQITSLDNVHDYTRITNEH